MPIEKGTKRFLINQEFEVGKRFSTIMSGRVFTEIVDDMYDEWIIPKTISMRGAKIRKSEAFVVLGAIDPSNEEPDGTEIDDNDILGFMFGGGEDQLGYFVLKRK